MKFPLQIAKIVGQPEKERWSQVHSFFPQDKEKRREYGNLLLVITLSKKTDVNELDFSSYGKEVIQRFHETYFSAEDKDIFQKLKVSVAKLKEEFSQELEFDLVAGVVRAERLYLIRKGRGAVFIKRGEKKTLLFSSGKEKVASGRLEAGDFLVLGTGWFFDNVTLKHLAEVAEINIQEGAEELAAQTSGSSDNAQIAALVVKTEAIGEANQPDQPTAAATGKEKLSHFLGFLKETLWPFFSKIKEKVKTRLPSRRDLYLKKQQGEFKKRKRVYLFLALFLIVLLSFSIFLQGKKIISQKEQAAFGQALSFYEEAENLVEINPIKTRELLEEALTLLKDKELTEKEKSLREKIMALKEKVSGEYSLESAAIFQDLSLIREGTVGDRLSLYEDNLLVLDRRAGVVLFLDISNKSGKVQAAGLGDSQFSALTHDWGFVVFPDKIMGGPLEENQWQEIKDKDWGRVVDAKGFANNLYLLDREGQVLKFVAIEDGLADKTDYLKTKADFENAVSLAIDGSVWVLNQDGQIRKFTGGLVDAFRILGLDKPFANPEVLYTDENSKSLYILDKNNTRVVIINKSGEYQTQYVWGGIAGVSDMVVSEKLGKILLLSRDKIYEIEIKN